MGTFHRLNPDRKNYHKGFNRRIGKLTAYAGDPKYYRTRKRYITAGSKNYRDSNTRKFFNRTGKVLNRGKNDAKYWGKEFLKFLDEQRQYVVHKFNRAKATTERILQPVTSPIGETIGFIRYVTA